MLGAGLKLGHDLETASLISMFADAQVDPGDIVFDTDPYSCWINTYAALDDPTVVVLVARSNGSLDSGTPLELGISIGGVNATGAATAAASRAP